ncbi:MAG: hypothetical protein U0835_18365 [Isosphaeraceae bacterium]
MIITGLIVLQSWALVIGRFDVHRRDSRRLNRRGGAAQVCTGRGFILWIMLAAVAAGAMLSRKPQRRWAQLLAAVLARFGCPVGR